MAAADVNVIGTDPRRDKAFAKNPNTTTPLNPMGGDPADPTKHDLVCRWTLRRHLQEGKRCTALVAGTDHCRPKLLPRAQEPSTSTSLMGGGSATEKLHSESQCAGDRPNKLEQRVDTPTPHKQQHHRLAMPETTHADTSGTNPRRHYPHGAHNVRRCAHRWAPSPQHQTRWAPSPQPQTGNTTMP